MKKVGAGLLACLSFVTVLSACQSTTEQKPPAESQAQTAKPQDVYLQHCANCHGGNMEGGFGPALTKAGSKYSKEEILYIIQKGKGNMPSQDYVDKKDQVILAEYLSNMK